MKPIKGRVLVLGDDVDTDQILPGYAMAEPMEKLGEFAMAGAPDLDWKLQAGDIIVAGRNFGCGSSREQAPMALKQAGVSLIVAKSFARIFRRNAINIGLPVCLADVVDALKSGDLLESDLEKGNLRFGENGDKSLSVPPISPTVLETLECGGLIGRVKKELNAHR